MNNQPTPETDTVSELVGMGHFMVDSEFARKLERERNEAMEKAERYRFEANAFMMQRDEARKKVERQAERIRKLEGSTNHAGGTPLSVALSERDDALSQIVQAECRAERYCQERDEARNAIVGWENKWKFAVDMAARAELERDDALNKIKELNDILR